MPKPKKHVLVCTNQRPEGHPRGSCANRDAMTIWQKFADLLNEQQLYGEVLVSGVRSCLGPCGAGPIVVVYPEGTWYGGVTEADVEEIFESHLKGGEPVKRLELPDSLFA